MAKIRFTCACCGRTIEGLPDLAYDAPLHYRQLTPEEQGKAWLSADLCVVDEDRFVRVVCPIPILGADEFFNWGVWVSLSAANFDRHVSTFNQDQSHLDVMFGWLCNRIPGYPDTLNLQTTVAPSGGRQRPTIWINDVHADHPLHIEQNDGMTMERLGELYAIHCCDAGKT
jgi:hypothetical protein